jgi:uncharacterized protein (DUF924 family)
MQHDPTGDTPPEAGTVLSYWFGALKPKQRFARNLAVDADIRRQFADLHRRLSVDVPAEWTATPRGLLATVIVLDQFSRNLHRDSPLAFSNDAAALALVERALTRHDDAALSPEERHFLYMPLMHAEDAARQRRCVVLMERLGIGEALDYALKHKAIIDRFGRFPHRNAALGRKSTQEEQEFLAEPGSSF